jgi:hypothetical protein
MKNLTPEEAHQFHQLQFYIENQLLLQKLEGRTQWAFNHRDTIWQALCHHSRLALKSEDTGDEPALASEVRHMISAGAAMPGESIYPLQWDCIQLYAMRHPEVLAYALLEQHKSHIDLSRRLIEHSPIPLTGFEQHMKETKYGHQLILTKHPINDGVDLLVFDDGQFKTAVELCEHPDFNFLFATEPTATAKQAVSVPLNHPTLDLPEVREEIWRRCCHRWNDRLKMADPPKIRTEDNLCFDGSTVLAASAPELLKEFEQVKLLLDATLAWQSPKLVQEAVFDVLRKWVDARRTNGFSKGMGAAWEILPNDLKPHFL